MVRLKNKKILWAVGGAVGVIALFFATVAFAQISIDLPTNFAGFSSQDLRTTIENIVRIILGFIGFIFLLLILYGAFMWMTSGGLQDRVNRAKKILASAVIGLVITLMAYSISGFVITTLQQAVGGGGTTGGPPPPPLPGCLNPGPGIVKICGMTGGTTPGSVITINGHNFETYTDGSSAVYFSDGAGLIPAQIVTCSGSPVWSSTSIRAIVPGTVTQGSTYMVVVQAASGARCDQPPFSTSAVAPPIGAWDCQNRTIIAGAPPSIYCVDPTSGQTDTDPTTNTSITIDGTNFGAIQGSGKVEMQGSTGRIDAPRVTSWSDTQILYDLAESPPDPESAVTGDIIVYDNALQQSNGVLFTVTCTANNQCGSNCCQSNQCQPAAQCNIPPNPNAPFITGISPTSGEEGTYITISGRNFGATQGRVTYQFPVPDSRYLTNPFPSNLACTSNWSDTQVIIEVGTDLGANPAYNGDAYIQIRNTSTALDSNVVTFVQNDAVHPGLCKVDPPSGLVGAGFTLDGNNFGSTAAPPNDYVAYWKFDDAAGSVALDSSANNHDGTLSCKSDPPPAPPCSTLPQWTATGKVGGALTFDGVDDYVDLGDLSAYTHPISISFWYYLPDNTSRGQTFLANGSMPGFGNVYPYYVIHTNNGGSLHFYYPYLYSSQNIFNLAPRWLHITYVTDPASVANWRTYVNGVLQTNISVEASPPAGPPENFVAAGTYLGGSNFANFDFLKGSIDELRIYDRALSGAEVTALSRDIFFGSGASKVSANNKTFTSATTATANVPNMTPVATIVSVAVGGQDSNPLAFTVQSVVPGGSNAPVITAITPNNGAPGNLVTVFGRNFGGTPGQVTFTDSGNTQFLITTPPAACSASWWTDTQIILEIPDGATPAAQGAASIVVQNLGGLSSLPWTTFTVNSTQRPGLCSIVPTAGPFQFSFTISGKQFGAAGDTRDIFFGQPTQPISASNQSFDLISTPQTGTANVPNLQAGLTTIALKVNSEVSNPVNFTVESTPSGNPAILSFSPTAGPTGTYVTIIGSNFGSQQGSVYFVRTIASLPVCPSTITLNGLSRPACLADMNFPPMCSTYVWRNDRIVVKVPGSIMSTANNYFIVVRTLDGKQSQESAISGVNAFFTKDTSALSPGLCRIDPTGGPAGLPVRYDGENFGNLAGSVWFDVARQSTSTPVWGNQQILNAKVPVGAVTGTTTVRSSAGLFSNSLPFFVGNCTSDTQCGGSDKCCSGLCRPVLSCSASNYQENNWTFTSGEYPFDLNNGLDCRTTVQSPTPYPYEQIYTNDSDPLTNFDPNDLQQISPVNVDIAATFTRALDFATIDGTTPLNNADDNVKVYSCSGAWTGACTGATQVPGTLLTLGSNGFRFQPLTTFANDTWYEVRLDNGTANSDIAAVDGSRYHGSTFLYATLSDPQAFRWHFKTRTASQARCVVTDVRINPPALTVGVGATATMSASPINSQCYVCSSQNFAYQWTLNPPNPPIPNQFVDLLPSATANPLTVRGVSVTTNLVPNPYTDVTATLTNPPSGPQIPSSVPSHLTVDHIKPRIISFSPSGQCRAVCTNAIPYAVFNIPIDPTTVNGTSVRLNQCVTLDPTCPGYFPVGYTAQYPTPDRLNLVPTTATLIPNIWYRVIVRNSVRSPQGLQLDLSSAGAQAFDDPAYNGLNGVDSFSWNFQTSATICDPQYATVAPPTSVMTTIGGQQQMTATPYTNVYVNDPLCYAPIALNPTGLDWEWTSMSLANVMITSAGKCTLAPYAPCTIDSQCSPGDTCKGDYRQNATAIADSGGIGIPITADMLWAAGQADVFVQDLREPIDLIGHRPDAIAGTFSPPESSVPPPPVGCPLFGNPGSCALQCTNVLASAIFSTYLDPNSFTYYTIPGNYAGYYSFNNDDATDMSGNGRNGTLNPITGGPTFGTDVAFSGLGKSISFDGVDDYVDVSTDPSFAIVTQDLSVTFWIKSNSLPAGSTVASPISKGEVFTSSGGFAPCSSSLPQNNGWAFIQQANKYSVGICHNGATVRVDSAPMNTTDGQWHYIGIVARVVSSQRQVDLYVDGVKTLNWITYITPSEPRRLCFGARCRSAGGIDLPFKGSLDDIRIYRFALSDSEVQQINLEGVGLQVPPLNFHVVEYPSGKVVPGNVKVTNYEDVEGLCIEDTTQTCTSDADCWWSTLGCGQYRSKRGRVDYYPDLSKSYAVPKDYAAYYSFDDGTAQDLSVNGNDGFFQEDATPTPVNTQIPSLGSGVLFDGESVSSPAWPDGGDAVRVDDLSGKLAPPAGITVSAWVYPTSYDGVNLGIVSKRFGSWGGFWMRGDKSNPPNPPPPQSEWGKVWGRVHQGSDGAWIPINDHPTALQLNTWYHVVLTANSNTGRARIYIDGVAGPESNYSSTLCTIGSAGSCSNGSSFAPGTDPLLIGQQFNNPADVFDGIIDEVRIYRYALSALEVASLRQEDLGRIRSDQKRPKGIYDSDKSYQVVVCPGNSCLVKPIRSYQGVPFTTTIDYGFTTGANICKISFVEVQPDPAKFTDRQLQCVGGPPQCTSNVPKVLIAHAKDANGIELSAIDYLWRTTNDGTPAGPYVSKYYRLNQPVVPPASPSNNAEALHKGVQGVDYAQVTATSGTPGIDLGSATAQSKLDFSFCENPWYGTGGGSPNTYYQDPDYDFRLAYCRDGQTSGATPLPNLPAPHLVRAPVTPFTGGGDLLKEHVFIVGSTTSGGSTLNNTLPQFVNVPTLAASYKLGDLVSFKLEGTDAEGDSFIFTKTDEVGDPLPAGVSFNQQTGSFSWVVDQLPATGGAYQVNFGFNPVGQVITLTITVQSGVTPPPAGKPTVSVSVTAPIAAGPGDTIIVDYGTTVFFSADVTALGSGATAVSSFIWDFQDSGLTSYTDTSMPNPFTANHVFLQSGVHQVTFRAQNNLGAWSDPSVVNISVRPKTSYVPKQYVLRTPASLLLALRSKTSSFFSRVALGQTQFNAPSQLVAQSIGQTPQIQLSWVNNGLYTNIEIYRDAAAAPLATIAGTATSYSDAAVTLGTTYLYKVCGTVASVKKCVEVTTTARREDLDIIVSRVYKNLNLLSVSEWYKKFAPNPTGSPTKAVIDGYDALIDGTSVYIGVANCVNAASNGGTCGQIYGNILLMSYNQSAKASTIAIFDQLIDTLIINQNLTKRDDNVISDTCSQDPSVVCDPGDDSVCQTKNAGLCMSAKAELRRDFKRIVALHDIKSSLDTYAKINTYCNDGTNSIACKRDADCPRGNQCVGVYPSLNSGSYIAGMTTSQWPSWLATFGKALGRSSMPADPINQFGGPNFYLNPPGLCKDFPGFDTQTCWNERTREFKCYAGSEVFMYRNKNGTNFDLYGLLEDETWTWVTKDAKVIVNDAMYGGICDNVNPVTAVCGNGVIEGTEACDGGQTDYCYVTLSPTDGAHTWNNDFKVGCNATCTAWTDPYGGDINAARAACGGYCGDNSVTYPFEQCDTNNVLTPGPDGIIGTSDDGLSNISIYSCTAGGSVFCSNSCQISCTSGRPYSGACGNGIVNLPEACDEGSALNGTAGHCNSSCSGYGSYCGDGSLTPLVEYSLSCTCDSPVPTCNNGYTAVADQACTRTCAGGPAHNWRCVQNAEECDAVAGLTSYSCPLLTTLYCDSSCNRACSTIDTNGSGVRQNIPVYEQYFNEGDVEDYDYTLLKVSDYPYTTKAIAFYAYPGSSSSGNTSIYRFKSTTNADHRLSRNSSLAGYAPAGPAPYFKAYDSAINTSVVPVYEFRVSGSNGEEYYYSRNINPRTSASASAYQIMNGGAPAFYALLGPFQETCGNDIIEGNETCEPDVYQTPLPAISSATKQYACGQPFTANACQTYGGYCGDAAKNAPFEQCDEGVAFTCSGSLTDCKADTDCPLSTCNLGTQRCQFASGTVCSKNSDCPANSCNGNGALCNNSATNCTYCTKSCSLGVLARNFCGDDVVNCGLDNICATPDAYQEVCDDGLANNGKPGFCNDTCSGQTGSICGNNLPEQGETCDDGGNNGTWTYTCSNNVDQDCRIDGDCGGNNTCSNTPHPYCSFSCNGDTPVSCGDSVVQQPGAGPDQIPGTADDVDEVCDHGVYNGLAGYCNRTCTGLTPAVCGDGITGAGICSNNSNRYCQTDANCLGGGTCNGGETCDPPASTAMKACQDGGRCSVTTTRACEVDTDCPGNEICTGGISGLRSEQCSSICQSNNTMCQAFGLKIWSQGTDVAYLNGNLMLLNATGPTCRTDPDLQTADYSSPSSPPTGNSCTTSPITQAPDQPYDSASDVRPINSSNEGVADKFEYNGTNVVAVKVWSNTGPNGGSFEAVYTSPSARTMFPTTQGQTSFWSCSNDFTPGWTQIVCPDKYGRCALSPNGPCTFANAATNCPGAGNSCGPDGKSDCDTTVTANSWRKPVSGGTCPSYTSNVGGGSQWIWGIDCAEPVAYCRLEYQATNAVTYAAWNPNFGWIYFRTAGSQVTFVPASNGLNGAAWNKNLGWLFFDGTTVSANGATRPAGYSFPQVDTASGLVTGYAWGENYGLVNLNPKGTPCDSATYNCTAGFGNRTYTSVFRNTASGQVRGYAWSEKAGWIDFNGNPFGAVYFP